MEPSALDMALVSECVYARSLYLAANRQRANDTAGRYGAGKGLNILRGLLDWSIQRLMHSTSCGKLPAGGYEAADLANPIHPAANRLQGEYEGADPANPYSLRQTTCGGIHGMEMAAIICLPMGIHTEVIWRGCWGSGISGRRASWRRCHRLR